MDSLCVESVNHYFNTIVDLISSLALLLASIVAIYSIKAWKKEFVGKRRIELAERTLELFYQARDIISFMRSPFGYEGEGESRACKEGETLDQKQANNNAYVPFERYNKSKETFNEIYALKYRFMSTIDKDSVEEFHKLEKIIKKIFFASRRLATLWVEINNPIGPKRQDEISKMIEENERIFWFHSEDDEINKELDHIITSIERTCKKIISER